LQQGLGNHGSGWIDEHRDTSRSRYQLAQDFQSLGCKLDRKKIDPGEIAGGPRKAWDKAELDRVVANAKNDRDRGGCRFGREGARRAARRDDDRNLFTNQIGCQGW
jgi:hypothetical protein